MGFFTGTANKTAATLETAQKVYSLYESVVNREIDGVIQNTISLVGRAWLSNNKER